MKNTFSRMVAVVLTMWLGFATGTANASSVTTTYDFGNFLTGTNVGIDFSSDPFASLKATDMGTGTWDFTLTINNNLFSSFGSSAFIDLLKFDFSPNPSTTPKSTFEDSNVGGVTSVKSDNGDSSGGVKFDFGTTFGQGANNRLSQNDYVHWSVATLASGSTLNNMYIHVNGLPNGNSAKYTNLPPVVAPVPEPETYAMLLAGLGLIGFSARRRVNNV